ncbi:NFACT RNA binding domain-containing protein [Desulfurispira natronophila]|uniref:Putative ribosome quality control (RQC) complex YloA/Tae2 family protein n=1 Tax=Desulfurispira natronophila TaxID=682562 RepID=A0A7W8DHM5_9BACT|nr:NFACT RNA binding domain-containing protein [Desulfurispira natronophila]MBB5022604.1 putative ribosome quality control (RQC) complex YloA/Tae2 family protein [Desulfurispira natronophila]
MDYPTLLALADEIPRILGNGRLREVTMTDWHTVNLHFDNQCLVISAHARPNGAALMKVDRNQEREYPFVKAARMHLRGTFLLRCSVKENERIMRLSFGSVQGEVKRKYHLVLEIMGRHSNVIILDEKRRILAALKENWDISTARPVQVGQEYSFPPSQGRILPAGKEIFSDRQLSKSTVCLPAWLVEYFLEYPEDYPGYRQSLLSNNFSCNRLRYRNCVRSSPLLLPHAELVESFSSPSAMMASEWQEQPGNTALERKREQLIRRIVGQIEQEKNKVSSLREQLAQYKNTSEIARVADLIKYNLDAFTHNSRGHCTDYQTMETVEVEIPSDTTPHAYMKQLYKKIRKYHAALPHIEKQIQLRSDRIRYLADEQYYATQLDSLDEWLSLWERLFGKSKQDRHKKHRHTKGKDRVKKIDFHGYLLYVGLSSVANEQVTLHARGEDLWLHAKDIPGAHVVLQCHNRHYPEDRVIVAAAAVAAAMSRNASDGKVAVDYTYRKHVRKSPGSGPGTVYYTHFKTLMINQAQIQQASDLLTGVKP